MSMHSTATYAMPYVYAQYAVRVTNFEKFSPFSNYVILT